MIQEHFPDEPAWPRSSIAHYGNRSGPGESLQGELCDLFDNTRRHFLEDLQGVPIAHRAVRLRLIQGQVDRLLEEHSLEALDRVLALLEQARKEMDKAPAAILNLISGGVTVNLDLPDEYADELAQKFASRRLQRTHDGPHRKDE